LGQNRTAGIGKDKIKKRIPRNAPGLWNLGSKEITTLLHDGRISVSIYSIMILILQLKNGCLKGRYILAAQALFP